MALVTRILIAYDGSDQARGAVRATGRLLPASEAVVATAYETAPGLRKALLAGAIIDDAVQRSITELERETVASARATAEEGAALATEAGLRAQGVAVVTPGGIWPELLAVAQERDCELIVCGTRGRGGLGRALLGSTSTSLVYHADRSVLVVPPQDAATEGPIVVAYDGSDGAREAIETTGRLFGGAPVVVVHAWRSPIDDSLTGRALLNVPGDVGGITQIFEDEIGAAAGAVAEEGGALARSHGLDARAEAVQTGGAPWRAVAEVADDLGATVVVAGSRGRGGAASVLLGSVSAALVHNAERSTLVVRPPRAVGGDA
jgi:nucleotide-binding universal stress UspA family protein